MLNRVRGDYGAPYANRDPIVDPTTEFDAVKFNVMAEDMAEASRVLRKVLFQFAVTGGADTVASYVETQWGSGASYGPTAIFYDGAGLYSAQYPATFALPDGSDESVVFVSAWGSVQSQTVYGHVQCQASGALISIGIFDAAGAPVNLTIGTIIQIEAR